MVELYCTVQVSLGEDLPSSLTDGVVLCHIANHVSPRAVSSIHVPSPAVVSPPCYWNDPLNCTVLQPKHGPEEEQHGAGGDHGD